MSLTPVRPPLAFAAATPISLRRPRSTSSPARPRQDRRHSLYRTPNHVAPPAVPGALQPRMSSAAQELRRRIASVQSAEKIVSALRIVAAARIRASSQAALRTRPFAEELQNVLASLVHLILERDIHIPSIAHATPKHALSSTHGVLLTDPIVQKALMDKIYLTLLKDPASMRHEHLNGRRQPVTILTVLTADKGFCGSYNKDIISRAVRRIREMERAGRHVELIVVGKTAHTFFSRHYSNVPVRYYSQIGRTTDSEETATLLSRAVLSEFIAGGVDRIEVIYTRFLSLIASAPSVRTLLPLSPTGIETVGDEVFQLTLTTKNGRLITKRSKAPPLPDMHPGRSGAHHGHSFDSRSNPYYNVSDEEAILLLNSMLPMYVTSQLMRIVREAIASEQASRLTAMTAATDNAREIVTGLQALYNKERQARITKEIIEVVSNVNV